MKYWDIPEEEIIKRMEEKSREKDLDKYRDYIVHLSPFKNKGWRIWFRYSLLS